MKNKNNNKCYKIGRIKFKSWQNKVLKALDIIIYDSELIHIYNRHKEQLEKIGMTPIDFVKFIIANYTEIRKGNNDSYLLVVLRPHVSNVAAVRLMCVDSNGKECYLIKTATLYNTESLLKKKLLCANDH